MKKDPSKSRNDLIGIFWKRVETLRHNQIKNDLSFDNTDDLINNNPDMIETLNVSDESQYVPETEEETMI